MDDDKKPIQSYQDWLASLKSKARAPSNSDSSNLADSEEHDEESGDPLSLSSKNNNMFNSEDLPLSFILPIGSTSNSSPGGSSVRSSSTNEAAQHKRDDRNSTKIITKGSTAILENLTKSGFDPAQVQIDDKLFKKPPIIRRNKKTIPYALKNEQYWVQRNKNNLAARKSRQSRRVKEHELTLRKLYLEEQYEKLQQEYITELQNAIQNLHDSGNQQDNVPRVSVIQYASASGTNNNALTVDEYVKEEIKTEVDQTNLVVDMEEEESSEN